MAEIYLFLSERLGVKIRTANTLGWLGGNILAFTQHTLARIKGKIYARRFNHFLCGPPQWQVQKRGMQ